MMEELGRLGGETWFKLGDKDLALHLLRRRLLGQGASLTAVTRRLPLNDSPGLKPNGQVRSRSPRLLSRKARTESMARREATSPAWCPPMPSATTNNPVWRSQCIESSLLGRTFPG